jgi:hypothetical protein
MKKLICFLVIVFLSDLIEQRKAIDINQTSRVGNGKWVDGWR